jgi:hypothetical protein
MNEKTPKYVVPETEGIRRAKIAELEVGTVFKINRMKFTLVEPDSQGRNVLQHPTNTRRTLSGNIEVTVYDEDQQKSDKPSQ